MNVLRVSDLDIGALRRLVGRFGLTWSDVDRDGRIPGSYWGEPEAGLVGASLYARRDTPVHSVLHETCHFACMTPERRASLDRDAGGDEVEESAVCYLQVLLSEDVDGLARSRLFEDMDAWGYSFRLGSTARWFAEDADDARRWLKTEGLIGEGVIDDENVVTWKRRGDPSRSVGSPLKK